MKTRIWLPAALLAATVTISALVPGTALGFTFAHPSARAAAPHNDQGQAFSINGRIESVDYTANVIVLRQKGQAPVSIAITPTTSIDAGGQVGSIADLRPGIHVRVRGSVRDGTLVAESIVLK